MCPGRARTSNLQITNQILYQHAIVSLIWGFNFKSIFIYNRVQGLFLLAFAGTHDDAGISCVVGPPVTGVHDLAIVHDVAGILAVLGVSSVVGPTGSGFHALESLYPCYCWHPCSCQCFCCCWLCCCWRCCIMNVAAWCPCCCFFPAPLPEKSSELFRSLEGGFLHSPMLETSSGPGMPPFTFPHSGKFWSLKPGQVSLQGPYFVLLNL